MTKKRARHNGLVRFMLSFLVCLNGVTTVTRARQEHYYNHYSARCRCIPSWSMCRNGGNISRMNLFPNSWEIITTLYFFLTIYLFIYFWLLRVFVAAHRIFYCGV